MFCTRCGVRNAKTSKFCRECGKRLVPEIDPSQAQDEAAVEQQPVDNSRVGDLLFQAFQNLEGDKLDEALRLCQEALRLAPDSTAGHSLMAMVFEKKGELPAALRHYDRVLFLNPGSVADREKRDELRRRLGAGPAPVPLRRLADGYLEQIGRFIAEKRPWPEAIAASIACFILLMAVLPKASKPAPTPAQTQSAQQTYAGPQAQAYVPPQAPAEQAAPPQAGGDLPFGGGPTTAAPEYTPPAAQSAPVAAVAPGANYTGRRTRPLPSANERIYIPPIAVEVRPRNSNRVAPAPPTPATPTGTISIRTTPTPPARQEDPADKARRLQIAGDYDGAISAWRQALGGRNQGGVYQQIATCYQRLGQHKDAIANYQSAIRSYDQQIQSGDNADSAQRGKLSSELGLRVSQQAGG